MTADRLRSKVRGSEPYFSSFASCVAEAWLKDTAADLRLPGVMGWTMSGAVTTPPSSTIANWSRTEVCACVAVL